MLNVGDRSRIDIDMNMGTAQETVTVEANAVKVQTDSGEVSNRDHREGSLAAGDQRAKYLHVGQSDARSFQSSRDFQTPTPVGGDANVSFNGNRAGHTLYMLDGGEDLDRGGAGTFSVMPSVDAIAEFRALTSNYSAEYGLSSSATMTTVLKSGTKQLPRLGLGVLAQ